MTIFFYSYNNKKFFFQLSVIIFEYKSVIVTGVTQSCIVDNVVI